MKKFIKNYAKKGIWIIVILAMLICSIYLLYSHFSNADQSKEKAPITKRADVKEKIDATQFGEVKTTITTEMINEGLKEMGLLITSEYYFTQVEEYKKTKTVLKFFTSESNFTFSYDGVVSAGLDFSQIKVEKDDENKIVTVTMPKSAIQYVDIDHNSFQQYSESEGLWNPITVADYNDSMNEFADAAKAKAIEKGITNKADENAKKIVSNFVTKMVGNEYQVNIVVQ